MIDKYEIQAAFKAEYKRLRETVDEDGVLPAHPEVRTGHASMKLGHCTMKPLIGKTCISANGQGYTIDHFYFSTRILDRAALIDTIQHEVAHALAIYHYGPMATGKNAHSHLWKHFATMCGANPSARSKGGMDPIQHRYFIVCKPCDKTYLRLQTRSARWKAVAQGYRHYDCTKCGDELQAI